MRKRNVISLKTCANMRAQTIMKIDSIVDEIPLTSTTHECNACSLIVAPEANYLKKHVQVCQHKAGEFK